MAQIVETGDTLCLHYLIPMPLSPLPDRHECVMVYSKEGVLKATAVIYDDDPQDVWRPTLIDLDRYDIQTDIEWNAYLCQLDSVDRRRILDSCDKKKKRFTVIKPEWVLNNNQCEFLANTLDEIRTRPRDNELIVSTGGHSYYAFLSKTNRSAYYDRANSWKKYLEIKGVLEIPSTVHTLVLPVKQGKSEYKSIKEKKK